MTNTIPGFYYDEQRDRYFRIVDTGLATASNMADYSSSKIIKSKRDKQKNEKLMSELNSKFSAGAYYHSSAIRIHNEFGNATLLENSIGKFTNMKVRGRWKLYNRFHSADEVSSAQCMAWNDKYDQLFLGSKNNGQIICIDSMTLNAGIDSSDFLTVPQYNFQADDVYYLNFPKECGSSVMSIDISHGWLIAAGLSTQSKSKMVLWETVCEFSFAQKKQVHEWRSGHPGDCYSCSVMKTPRSLQIFAGGRRFVLHRENFGKVTRSPTTSDVTAVCSGMVKNKEIFLAGCRDGTVLRYDKDSFTNANQHKPLGFRLSSAVKHIRCLDDANYIIISCLNGDIGMYDRRFINWNINASESPRAVVNYLGYKADETLHDGFDLISTVNGSYLAVGNCYNLNIYDVSQSSPILRYSADSQSESTFGSINALKWTSDLGLFVLSDNHRIQYLSNKRPLFETDSQGTDC